MSSINHHGSLLPTSPSIDYKIEMAHTRASVNSARILTLGSWMINFGCQLYGMLSKPNMKEVAETYHFAFSPNPMFIAGFFSLQTIIQLVWMSKLFFPRDGRKGDPDAYGEPSQIKYAPIYALGNLCIAGWMIFWNTQDFKMSQALVTLNTLSQLFACFYLLPPMTRDNIWTHLVAQTFAGIGVLDFVDNGAVVLRYAAPPSTAVQVITGVVFGLGALFSNTIFSVSLLYDLIAIYYGQGGPWARALGWMVLAVGIVVLFKLVMFRLPGSLAL